MRSSLHQLLRARRSPNDFAEFCFTDAVGRPLQQAALHRDLQEFLSRHRRALIELPRDHGKSVQACLRVLWELGHDPSLRVKIVCASQAMAAERCRFLRDAIADNRRLRLVFPELRPAQPWGTTRFTIERPANVIGPSLTAIGVGSVSTGSRADLLICDDVVDVKALRSRADRERVKAFFHENLMNLLEPDGRFWGLFTPWHKDDVNSVLKHNPAYVLFRRGVGADLEPVWPQKWPRHRLEVRRREIGSVSFARAYRLVCVPDEAVPIKAEWVQFWWESREPRAESREPAGYPQSAGSPHSALCSPHSALCSPPSYETIVLAVDPAVSCKSDADRTALVTLGRTERHGIHCLEAIARQVMAPELAQWIDAAEQRWQPDVILFEANAAFAGICDLLARHPRFGFKIKPVVQTKDRTSRIHAFSIVVENGTFRLRGLEPGEVHPSQRALFDEMTTFPFASHDDLLDAAAMGTASLLEYQEPRVW